MSITQGWCVTGNRDEGHDYLAADGYGDPYPCFATPRWDRVVLSCMIARTLRREYERRSEQNSRDSR